VSGSAKKALNASEWPSSNTALRALPFAALAVLRPDFVTGFLVLTFRSLPVGHVGSNPLYRDITSNFRIRKRNQEEKIVSPPGENELANVVPLL
jgi:hypothetical protein